MMTTEPLYSNPTKQLSEDQLRAVFIAVFNSIRPGHQVLNLRKAGFKVKVNHFRYSPEGAEDVMVARSLFGGPASDEDQLQSYYDLRKAHETSPAPIKEHYISSKGGCTEMSIIVPHDNKEFKVKANCCLLDPYNRRKGVQICLQRIFGQMLKEYQVSKTEVKLWVLEAEATASIETT